MRRLCAGTKQSGYTLAVRQLVAGETTSDVPLSFLNCLTALTSASRPSTLDRGFYNSTGLKLLYAHNYAYVMPIVKGRNDSGRTQQRLEPRDRTRSRRRGDVSCVHRLCLPARTVRRTRVARHGYAADAPFIDTPRDARNHYSKRFGIESSYRLAKQSPRVHQFSGCWTAAGDVCSEPIASRTAGGIFTGGYVAAPAAGRRLWRWSFTEFCEMVLRAAWTALGVRRSVPANQPLDDRFFR